MGDSCNGVREEHLMGRNTLILLGNFSCPH
jgi:hypothetical protein